MSKRDYIFVRQKESKESEEKIEKEKEKEKERERKVEELRQNFEKLKLENSYKK